MILKSNFDGISHEIIYGYGMHYNSISPTIFARSVFALNEFVEKEIDNVTIKKMNFYFKLPNYFHNSVGTVYSSLLTSYISKMQAEIVKVLLNENIWSIIDPWEYSVSCKDLMIPNNCHMKGTLEAGLVHMILNAINV